MIERVHKSVTDPAVGSRIFCNLVVMRPEQTLGVLRIDTIWRLCAAWLLIAAIYFSFPQAAHSGVNIAGNYRGLLTTCLAARQPNLCRNGLLALVRMAEEVDSRRAEWEAAGQQTDNNIKDQLYAEYSKAVNNLNEAVVTFNNAMEGR